MNGLTTQSPRGRGTLCFSPPVAGWDEREEDEIQNLLWKYPYHGLR